MMGVDAACEALCKGGEMGNTTLAATNDVGELKGRIAALEAKLAEREREERDIRKVLDAVYGPFQVGIVEHLRDTIRKLTARAEAAEAACERLRNELSDGIAFAFNMMEPRTVEDTRDTLDEQLSVLEESYRARGNALAAERAENERLRTEVRLARADRDSEERCHYRACDELDAAEERGARAVLRYHYADSEEPELTEHVDRIVAAWRKAGK
jgi:chromosome segregation ATPase